MITHVIEDISKLAAFLTKLIESFVVAKPGKRKTLKEKLHQERIAWIIVVGVLAVGTAIVGESYYRSHNAENQRLKGQWYAINCSLELKELELAIWYNNSARKNAAEKRLLEFGEKAIDALSGIRSSDLNLWQNAQRINHLSLAQTAMASCFATQDAERSHQRARTLGHAAIDGYRELFELSKPSASTDEVTRLKLPALKADATWFRAIACAVLVRVEPTKDNIHEAAQELARLKSENSGTESPEEEPNMKWFLEHYPDAKLTSGGGGGRDPSPPKFTAEKTAVPNSLLGGGGGGRDPGPQKFSGEDAANPVNVDSGGGGGRDPFEVGLRSNKASEFAKETAVRPDGARRDGEGSGGGGPDPRKRDTGLRPNEAFKSAKETSPLPGVARDGTAVVGGGGGGRDPRSLRSNEGLEPARELRELAVLPGGGGPGGGGKGGGGGPNPA